MIALGLCFQIKNLATLGRRRSLRPARMAVEVVKAQVANLRQQRVFHIGLNFLQN